MWKTNDVEIVKKRFSPNFNYTFVFTIISLYDNIFFQKVASVPCISFLLYIGNIFVLNGCYYNLLQWRGGDKIHDHSRLYNFMFMFQLPTVLKEVFSSFCRFIKSYRWRCSDHGYGRNMVYISQCRCFKCYRIWRSGRILFLSWNSISLTVKILYFARLTKWCVLSVLKRLSQLIILKIALTKNLI